MPDSTWTQDRRLLAIETPLGKDKLLLASLSGEEAISELFSYEVDLLSTDHAIPAESLIGERVKLTITSDDGTSRAIHAMVAQWRTGPVERELRLYRARLVPWPWFLGQSTDCRIFQNLSVPEIVEQVFRTFGFSDYQFSLAQGDYPKLEFCVQYRETALNFVSRLMEEAGIFYYFRHEADRHVMVIADKNVTFKALPDQQLFYAPESRRGHVTLWEHSFEFKPGRWAQRDFDFEKPSSDLTTSEKTLLKLHTAPSFERYDYPGRYLDKGRGTKIARMLMQAEEASHHGVLGGGNYPALDVGRRFTLALHPCEPESAVYVIRRVRHEATDRSHLSQTEPHPSRYTNYFEAMPYDVPFRPLRTTDKPFVHGPQTAMVVGPAGEKIHTDKYGRVRVQFHWDRYGKHDDKSSCWIRVSHAWAGRGWGSVHLPHVGHEVIVSFLEGDPDRPLITGRVYNGENQSSIKLPGDKTQSGLRDHSGNEILMEGKSGSEDIRVHAVKDMHVNVDNDREMHVKSHLTETVNKGQEVTVHQGYKETITEGATATISGGKKLSVTDGSTVDITGAYTTTVTGPTKHSSTETTDIHATGAGTYTSDASLKFAVAGSVIEITPSSITISTGPSTVKLDASGVSVSGPQISLNG
jgi:type VI secretion system secreted protein VgrG